jgi:deoxycytidylate deaminase
MGLAWMMAGFSKDPNTQVGSLIIDPQNNWPLGWGYNGPPGSIPDDGFSWERPEKYDWVVHAEENAIDHSQGCLVGSHLYVTHRPCKRCMIKIVSKKIAKVVYMDTPSAPGSSIANQEEINKTLQIAQLGGVCLEEFKGSIEWIDNWTAQLKERGVIKEPLPVKRVPRCKHFHYPDSCGSRTYDAANEEDQDRGFHNWRLCACRWGEDFSRCQDYEPERCVN